MQTPSRRTRPTSPTDVGPDAFTRHMLLHPMNMSTDNQRHGEAPTSCAEEDPLQEALMLRRLLRPSSRPSSHQGDEVVCIDALKAATSSNRHSELMAHIQALRGAMTPSMLMACRRRPGSASNFDAGALAHEVNYDILRDLRFVFQSSTDPTTGAAGLPEAEFCQVFGRVVCGPKAEEETILAWCRSNDARCCGVISWKDLTAYLVRCASSDKWTTRHAAHNRGGVASPGHASIRFSASVHGSVEKSPSRMGGRNSPTILTPQALSFALTSPVVPPSALMSRSQAPDLPLQSSFSCFPDAATLMGDGSQDDEDDETAAWERDLHDTIMEGKSFHSKGHNAGITKILPLPHVQSILTASTDGSVRRWDQNTLVGDEHPLHVGNEWITGLVKVQGANRICVLHSDRSIFFYNVSPDLSKGSATAASGSPHHKTSIKRHFQSAPPIVEYYRGFTQDNSFITQMALTADQGPQTVMLASQIKKHVPGEAAQRAPLPIANLISTRKALATSLVHLSSTPVVETVVVGNGDGSIEMIPLRLQASGGTLTNTATVAPTPGESSVVPHHDKGNVWTLPRVHRGAVSHMQLAPELQALISSGARDGQIIVTNLEHLVTTQTLACDLDIRKAKPITQFDYHPSFQHTLVHGYGRQILVWSALTGVRNHTIPDLDAVVLHCSMNPSRNRLYALTEGKTVRVFDIRTWKQLDMVSDDVQRMPVDDFRCLAFHEGISCVLTGAANLYAWRTADVQRRMEDNAGRLSPTASVADLRLSRHAASSRNAKRAKAAHEEPVLTMHYVPNVAWLVTADTTHVVVWSVATRRKLHRWRWPFPTTIMCLHPSDDGRRLLIGADDGSLRWVSVATGVECASLTHSVGNRAGKSTVLGSDVQIAAGVEVSACWVEPSSVVARHSLCLGAVGSYILAWLYNTRAPVTSASQKSFTVFRELHLQPLEGIVHSFGVSGVDRSCLIAATNSGRVVIFNGSLVVSQYLSPHTSIAAELIVPIYPHLVGVTYSDGTMRLMRTDPLGSDVRLEAVWAARSKHDCVTAATSCLMELPAPAHRLATRDLPQPLINPPTYLVALGDSSGHVSLFCCCEDVLRKEEPSLSLVCCWSAHDSPISGVFVHSAASHAALSSSTAAVYRSSHPCQSPSDDTSAAASQRQAVSQDIRVVTTACDGRLREWYVELAGERQIRVQEVVEVATAAASTTLPQCDLGPASDSAEDVGSVPNRRSVTRAAMEDAPHSGSDTTDNEMPSFEECPPDGECSLLNSSKPSPCDAPFSAEHVALRMSATTSPKVTFQQASRRATAVPAGPRFVVEHVRWELEQICECGEFQQRASHHRPVTFIGGSSSSVCEVSASHAFVAQPPPPRGPRKMSVSPAAATRQGTRNSVVSCSSPRGGVRRGSLAPMASATTNHQPLDTQLADDVGLCGASNMTRRFLSFSNLLGQQDRTTLFGATMIQDSNGVIRSSSPGSFRVLPVDPVAISDSSAAGSPNRNRKGTLLNHALTPEPQRVSSGDGAVGSRTAPAKRYRYGNAMTSSAEVDDEFLKRPFSRVGALRQLHSGAAGSDSSSEDANDDTYEVHSEGGGSSSDDVENVDKSANHAEKRIRAYLRQKQQERRERQEGGGEEFRPYFARLKLQSFRRKD